MSTSMSTGTFIINPCTDKILSIEERRYFRKFFRKHKSKRFLLADPHNSKFDSRPAFTQGRSQNA